MDLLALMMLYATSPVAATAIPPSSPLEPEPKAIMRPADPWRPYIAEAARRFNLPQDWIRSVMQVESSGRTTVGGRPITSPRGAMGLMQLMPDTYARLREEHRLGPDPHNPRDNILAGTAYLRAMYDRFGWPGLFAAYNAGPARFEAHLRAEQPLPAETRRYLATLGVETDGYRRRPANDSGPANDVKPPGLDKPGLQKPGPSKRVRPRPVPERSVQLVQNDMRGALRALDGP